MSPLKLETCKSYKTLLSLKTELKNQSLTTLLADHDRCDKLIKTYGGVTLDLSRELLTLESFDLLVSLCNELKIKEKSMGLFTGDVLNSSEHRPVLHTALRLPRDEEFHLDGQNVTRDVHHVLDQIKQFSEDVRSGKIVASDGKPFDSFLCIGIGGSFLGSLFTTEAFMGYPPARESSKNMKVRFLSNIDPASLRSVTSELDPNRTMAIVTSKTFSTMETIKNGYSVRKWLTDNIEKPELVGNHLCAISTNVKLASEFGIDESRIFPFWEWVGGRFSVCSSVGLVPLSLMFGYDMVELFLRGCRDMDLHFKNEPVENNLPFLMALTSFYNSTILGYNVVALLPYSHDLSKFPQYAQQLIMESNGKSVSNSSEVLTYETSEIYFGECGTNGQHSFYQMLHQGRTVPCEFIGIINSHNNDNKLFSRVNHHVELICNLFGQLDGLAFGKSPGVMTSKGVDEKMARFKMSNGNRPSLLLLFDELTPYSVGQLISLYEHRTAVQGFLWDINSFDQMGVELGKELANNLRSLFQKGVEDFSNQEDLGTLSYSTTVLLKKFMERYRPEE
ncbi:glucose-6-phosphate isomerase [Theileria orientalis strain Shintoku]|uniref:Glucose-6-phosphate isomerase n=1 Tax=Theileria orientalis strain Shintoku TaxID=869250 RepID=J4DPT1_THEOR|nr:glucose-6-phosphate isomerase [Theileria orientalis strain Shintoku]PVC51804.1 glucose-6-phosphate isomerase [Theileria orientalis]BAM41244.1 glucose-6-phosphate isomerase [Theileria orientalis strain Shintoku]|eukprot:XP_009691545.1 glucose-6-phosphate isomerase [Theileria orientalis strain Shintoku]